MKSGRLFDVRGLATIVTGAASGIGLADAEAMAENALVPSMDKDRSPLTPCTSTQRTRRRRSWPKLDVTDRQRRRRASTARRMMAGSTPCSRMSVSMPPGFMGMICGGTDGGVRNVSDERWQLAMEPTRLDLRTIKASVRIGRRCAWRTHHRHDVVAVIGSEAIVARLTRRPKPARPISSAKQRWSWGIHSGQRHRTRPFITEIAGEQCRTDGVAVFVCFTPLQLPCIDG